MFDQVSDVPTDAASLVQRYRDTSRALRALGPYHAARAERVRHEQAMDVAADALHAISPNLGLALATEHSALSKRDHYRNAGGVIREQDRLAKLHDIHDELGEAREIIDRHLVPTPFNCPAGRACTGAAFPGHVAHEPFVPPSHPTDPPAEEPR